MCSSVVKVGKFDFAGHQESLRKNLLAPPVRKILLANLQGSRQSEDEYTKINSNGYGRIREYTNFQLHFDENQRPKRLSGVYRGQVIPKTGLRTQVYQIAGCDLRCWYCFVDFQLLSASETHGRWFSALEIIENLALSGAMPSVIELSGGQVELVPEWTLWMMQALEKLGLDRNTTIWSDDNLTSDFFWKYLSPNEQEYVRCFPGYSRAVCLKGIDETSFAANTGFNGELFSLQLKILGTLVKKEFPLLVYLTLTDIPRADSCTERVMNTLIEKLEQMKAGFSREIIPLRMASFQNMLRRANYKRLQMFGNQHDRFRLWKKCVNARTG